MENAASGLDYLDPHSFENVPDPSMQDSKRAVDDIAKQINGFKQQGMSDKDIAWELHMYIDSLLPLPFVVKRCTYKKGTLNVSYGAFDGMILEFSVSISDVQQ
jgi:hypothetical protein